MERVFGKWRSSGKIIHILFVSLFLLFTQSASADVAEGVSWLESQHNVADGSYALETDIANSYQSTAETLSLFNLQSIDNSETNVSAKLSTAYH